MKKMKQVLLSLLIAVLCLVNTITPALADQDADAPDVYAAAYCVMDRITGEIIFQKNMDERHYPASITKVMTALVTLEHISNLDDTLTFSENAINSLSANSSTLSPKAQVGEVMTVRDALYGLLLNSANECGNALAEYVAGSNEAFAELMNAKAAEVGAVNTHFANPHGLHDEEHYTTAHDMALIFQVALRNESFLDIDSTLEYHIPATNMTEERVCGMTHQLLNGTIECEGAYAGKTGNTLEAGRTLVTAAKRYGYDLLFVEMQSDQQHFYADAQILMEYAFGKVNGSYPNLGYQEIDDTVYVSGSLRVREFASTHAIAVASVGDNQALHRLGTYAGWSRVDMGDGLFYVATSYLHNEQGEAVEGVYETLTPVEAQYPQEETTVEETVIQTEPQTEALESTQEETTETPTTQSTQPASNSGYEISEDILVIIILIVVALIAVTAGILVAVLIMRKA